MMNQKAYKNGRVDIPSGEVLSNVYTSEAKLTNKPRTKYLKPSKNRYKTYVLNYRMMQILKRREKPELETDQGYSSAKTSPNVTPSTSPNHHSTSSSSSCSTSSRTSIVDKSYRQHPVRHENFSTTYLEPRRQDVSSAYLDVTDTNLPVMPSQDYTNLYRIPIDMSRQRVNHPADYRFCRSSRLLESGYDGPSTSMAVKRGLDGNVEIDRKRYRMTSQLSQVVL